MIVSVASPGRRLREPQPTTFRKWIGIRTRPATRATPERSLSPPDRGEKIGATWGVLQLSRQGL
jgi:hypothetical protein